MAWVHMQNMTGSWEGPPSDMQWNTTYNSGNSAYYLTKILDKNSNDLLIYDYVSRTIEYTGGFSESVEFHENNDPKYSTIKCILS